MEQIPYSELDPSLSLFSTAYGVRVSPMMGWTILLIMILHRIQVVPTEVLTTATGRISAPCSPPLKAQEANSRTINTNDRFLAFYIHHFTNLTTIREKDVKILAPNVTFWQKKALYIYRKTWVEKQQTNTKCQNIYKRLLKTKKNRDVSNLNNRMLQNNMDFFFKQCDFFGFFSTTSCTCAAATRSAPAPL